MRIQHNNSPTGPNWEFELDRWVDRALALLLVKLLAPGIADQVLHALVQVGRWC